MIKSTLSYFKHCFDDIDTKIERICRKTGNVDELRRLVSRYKGLNINDIKYDGGWSALHIACMHGNVDIVYYLITLNIDPSIKNLDNYATPLHMACWSGHLNIVQLLVEFARACPEDKSIEGYTCLHYAAWAGHLHICKYLIKQNVFISSKSNDDFTPLLLASRCGKEDVVRYFIENTDTNINDIDCNGCSVLHHACWDGHKAVVKTLLRTGANLDVVDCRGRRPVDLSKTKEIRDMLHNHMRNNNRTTPVYSPHNSSSTDVGFGVTVIRKNAEAVAIVNEDVNNHANDSLVQVRRAARRLQPAPATPYDKGVPLSDSHNGYWVASNSSSVAITNTAASASNITRSTAVPLVNVQRTQLNSNSSSNHDTQSESMATPVGNYLGSVSIDIKAESVSDARSTSIKVPKFQTQQRQQQQQQQQQAHVSIPMKDDDSVHHNNSKRNNIDSDGRQQLQVCWDICSSSDSAIVSAKEMKQFLISNHDVDLGSLRDSQSKTLLIKAVERGKLQLCKLLVAVGVDASCRDNEGDDAVTIAASLGYANILCFLIDDCCGVNVNNRNLRNTTALHKAAAGGHYDSVCALIDRGCSINCQDKDGATPLHLCCYYGHQKVVLYLVEQPLIDLTVTNNAGRTAMDLVTNVLIKRYLVALSNHRSAADIKTKAVYKVKLDFALKALQLLPVHSQGVTTDSPGVSVFKQQHRPLSDVVISAVAANASSLKASNTDTAVAVTATSTTDGSKVGSSSGSSSGSGSGSGSSTVDVNAIKTAIAARQLTFQSAIKKAVLNSNNEKMISLAVTAASTATAATPVAISTATTSSNKAIQNSSDVDTAVLAPLPIVSTAATRVPSQPLSILKAKLQHIRGAADEVTTATGSKRQRHQSIQQANDIFATTMTNVLSTYSNNLYRAFYRWKHMWNYLVTNHNSPHNSPSVYHSHRKPIVRRLSGPNLSSINASDYNTSTIPIAYSDTDTRYHMENNNNNTSLFSEFETGIS